VQLGRIRACLGPPLALVLALAALGIAAPAAGAAEVGVNVAATSGDFFHDPQVLAALRESKPAWVRVFLGWNGLEPAQGAYNSAEIANYLQFFDALPADTKIDVDVSGSPAWANGGSSDTATPPVNDADYAGFVNYLVNAFDGRVTGWEIWNEEDNSGWWNGTPAQYAALLKAVYPAIKSADPSATVIVGGLTGNDGAYLEQLYAGGAEGSFDAVGIHTDTACNIASPYDFEFNPGTSTINQYFFLGFDAIHAEMVSAGDGAKPIYITELGWSTTDAECETGHWAGQKPGGVSEQTQAIYLQQAYHCLAQPQFPYVKAAMWFELFDEGSSTDPLDNFGLLGSDYAPKPAFSAFEQESLHGDQLSGPCGDFAAPRIKIVRPTAGRYRGPLRIAVRASDPGAGVREIMIQLNRHSRVRFVSRGSPGTFSASIAWRTGKAVKPGPHTIKVIVTSQLGDIATKTVRVVRMPSRVRTSREWRRVASP
jgi:hypothetical protein